MPQPATFTPQNRIHLRPMSAHDLGKVYALEVQCQPYPWPRWLFRRQLRRNASCWVLELEDEIVAFGIVAMTNHRAHIMNMYVASQWGSDRPPSNQGRYMVQ